MKGIIPNRSYAIRKCDRGKIGTPIEDIIFNKRKAFR